MPASPHIFYPCLLLSFLSPLLAGADISIGIGIGIGGGGGESNPPPKEPPCGPPRGPQPSDFVNMKQYYAYFVIQRFKNTITCDPDNVTATWVGYRPCTYKGFYCETPPGLKNTPTIASIDFNQYKLRAPTVCNFVDKLPDLALFHANSNNFGGTVPDLTKSKYLYELDLSNNKLTGAFPNNLLPLSQLTFIDIRFNKFAGCVPAGIFLLDVDVLFLNNNGFSQPLPATLGKSPVAYLTLANNQFTGPIPASICNMSNTLIEVLFLNNRLSGCLPFEVGLLKEATVFDAGYNRITGPIPLSFGCLKKVEQLNLAGNLLYGTVPDVVCRLAKCGNLANLSLSDNYFTSIGSSCWELVRTKVLDVRKNCIPGLPGQRPACDCAAFNAKPKHCPYIKLIPCAYQHSGVRARDGSSSRPVAALDSANRTERGSVSVAYKALHGSGGR